jgi:hypothetical protein
MDSIDRKLTFIEALGFFVLLELPMQWKKFRQSAIIVWLTGTWSPRAERRMWVITTLVILPWVLFSAYTMASLDCQIGGGCLFANADWANWLTRVCFSP